MNTATTKTLPNDLSLDTFLGGRRFCETDKVDAGTVVRVVANDNGTFLVQNPRTKGWHVVSGKVFS